MRPRVVLFALLVSLLQVALHASGLTWVIPNLALLFVVWYAPKLEYVPMTFLIILMSAILETGSVLPTGLMMLGLFLVMLASKLVFREGRDANKWSFQLALVVAATIIFNIVVYASLPAGILASQLGQMGLRIALEVLYNSSILLLIVGLSDRRQPTHPHFRLPQ